MHDIGWKLGESSSVCPVNLRSESASMSQNLGSALGGTLGPQTCTCIPSCR